jgi:hypothetical protein
LDKYPPRQHPGAKLIELAFQRISKLTESFDDPKKSATEIDVFNILIKIFSQSFN